MNRKNIQLSKANIQTSLLGKPHLLAENSLKTIDWSKKVALLDNYNNETTPSIRVLKSNESDDQVLFVVDELLSKEECDVIIKNCEQYKLQAMEDYYKTGRTNSRLILFDEDFATYIWQKMHVMLPDVFSVEKSKPHPLGFDVLRGTWEFSGINQAMRFNKYRSDRKESFKPHRDSQFCPSGDERSLLSIVIYLNDDFKGGDTKFYFPKDKSIVCKGLTMEKEFKKYGGLKKGYDCVAIKPKFGSAVVFSQSIIHESKPLVRRQKDEFKYIVKTDLMLKRSEKQYGFCVTEEEKEDYFECLNLFRNAQQEELKDDKDVVKTHNLSSAAELYEKCLSIRYSYPTKSMLSQKHLLDDSATQLVHCNSQSVSISSSQDAAAVTEHSKSAFLLFPMEVWMNIISNIQQEIDSQNLIAAFPDLLPVKRKVDVQKIIPSVDYNKGIFTKFRFPNADFVKANIDDCSRVVALYSVYLLGHSEDNKVYTVNYNPETGEVVAINLHQFLADVFYKEKSYGAVFKVTQQNDSRNVSNDFFVSVDRRFMTTKYEKEFIGIDVEETFCCNLKVSRQEGSDSGPCLDTEGSMENREVINYFNRFKDLLEEREERGVEDEYEIFEIELDTQDYYESVSEFDVSCNVGAAVVCKLQRPVSVNGSEYCVCGIGGYSVPDTLKDNCKILTFNHLIADFSKQVFSVSKNEGDCCFDLEERVKHDVDIMTGKNIEPCFVLKVDISSLDKENFSFNHASCQCTFPEFKLDEFVDLQSYPYLNHIHVMFVEYHGEMFAWTSYGGIAAL